MKVSVLLTTYNHERYVAEALDSILAQRTTFPYEIIIIEDRSTDGTRDILRKYAAREPGRITLRLAERNACDNRAFGEAFLSCRGEYVVTLDGDDYWLSHYKLQRQVEYMDVHRGCAICFHNVRLFFDDGSRDPRNLNPPDQKVVSGLEDLWAGNFIASCSAMLRKGLVREFPEWFVALPFGDWPLYILHAEHGTADYLNEVMSAYRVHRGGVWSGLDRIGQLQNTIAFYEAMQAHAGHAPRGAIGHHLAGRWRELAAEHQRRGDLRSAASCLRLAVQAQSALSRDPVERRGDGLSQRRLRHELWLCEHPWAYAAMARAAHARREGAWFWRRLVVWSGCAGRIARNRPSGALKATPNPVLVGDVTDLGATTLSWATRGVANVEVRVGEPDGALFSSGGPSGTAQTGTWVKDGTVFYLQNVSESPSNEQGRTLAVARVTVRPNQLPDHAAGNAAVDAVGQARERVE